MNDLIRAAAEVQAVCELRDWKFCFIGGLAVQRWGEPRLTADVDLTLLTEFDDEARFISVLMAAFEPRIDDAANFASANRVLLLRSRTGVGIDIALGGLPFEVLATERATSFTFPPDVPLRICSAEDLIVFKGHEKPCYVERCDCGLLCVGVADACGVANVRHDSVSARSRMGRERQGDPEGAERFPTADNRMIQ